MKRSFFFVDGFNFYHSIDTPDFQKYKWLNYYKLASILIRSGESLEKVLLFTALAEWDQRKVIRHKLLISALENEGVEVIYGKFKRKEIVCRICGGTFDLPIEKQTDVNIASNLIKYAIRNEYDKAYVVSGDTDLIPAIKTFKDLFPQKEVCVVFPFSRKGEELKGTCDSHMKIKRFHLQGSLFPDPIVLKNGSSISCPITWK